MMATKGKGDEDAPLEDPGSQDGKEKFTFFFGSDSPFSNHHMTEFEVDGITYNCTEQYMMHQKAGNHANCLGTRDYSCSAPPPFVEVTEETIQSI